MNKTKAGVLNHGIMKAVFLFSFIVWSLSAGYAQTIRRVNNNPGVTGVNVYSSAQAAHDAAAANDILLIEPSDTNYGTLILTKPLKIYGNGYFLDVNTELRADDRLSDFQTLQFNTGSGGSEVYGIDGSIQLFGVSNVRIERCEVTGLNLRTSNLGSTADFNVSNVVIHSNYINGSISASGAAGFTIADIWVTNNIMSPYYNMNFTTDEQTQSWVVKRNYFYNARIVLYNSVFEDNLCNTSGSGSIEFNNVTYSYNVSSSDDFIGGIGNQNNFDLSNEFSGTGSADEKLMIKSTSTLKAAASDGGEIGPFGGTNPYLISGIPPIPSITEMYNTATGSNDVPLQVTISVQANN